MSVFKSSIKQKKYCTNFFSILLTSIFQTVLIYTFNMLTCAPFCPTQSIESICCGASQLVFIQQPQWLVVLIQQIRENLLRTPGQWQNTQKSSIVGDHGGIGIGHGNLGIGPHLPIHRLKYISCKYSLTTESQSVDA